MSLRFVSDVPVSNRRRFDWGVISTALKENAGQWAVINDDGSEWPRGRAHALTSNINAGRLKLLPKGQFEAVSRGSFVYVRYVGGGVRSVGR